MSEQQTITIEVDGEQLQAQPGQMLIEVTDAAGITVPRFCYHKKLSVAANCRMCLVEVENAPKPLPACATPVADGMKVYTRSPLAREAQKGTMEFLLINHPLDCPICDQGGECELQDVAMGFGGDVSRYNERKRVVKDEDIGALISTDMTRCIHCTRCVRFGDEIAGLRELGATGRGEHMRIGVYVAKTVSSELSGNVIDLCPVGALTSKPFRYTARAWELAQRDSVAPHDAIGSNIHVHIRRNRIMRVVPRENEAVNETWISDRDRFSYEGIYSDDRLLQPMRRVDGKLQETDWHNALIDAAGILKKSAAGKLGTLVSPSSTLEEMYLAQKLTRGLGSDNIDHRLRQIDFRSPEADPGLPWLGKDLAGLENNQATLLVGSWLRKDLPLLNLRLRKSIAQGGKVMAINPIAYDFNYELYEHRVAAPSAITAELAGVARALGIDTAGIDGVDEEGSKRIAEALKESQQGSILLGSYALSHPDYSVMRALAGKIADATGTDLGFVADGANSLGGWMSGALPHRGSGGQAVEKPGMDTEGMLAGGLEACMLVGMEPEFDTANPLAILRTLQGAKVVALASHLSPWLAEYADVVLPVGTFAETSGSYVNIQGDVQSFNGTVTPMGEARPAWKVLRVLANLADVADFDYQDSEQVRDEVLAACADQKPDNKPAADSQLAVSLKSGDGLERIGGTPIYSTDALVRRAPALQRTPDHWSGIKLNENLASQIGLGDGDSAVIKQGEGEVTLPVVLDSRVPDRCVWLPTGVPGSELLGEGFGMVSLEKA